MRNRVKPSLTTAPVRECTNHGGFGQDGALRQAAGPQDPRDRAGERTEGPAGDRSLDVVEQQRVVHDADAADDVIERRARVAAPRERSA